MMNHLPMNPVNGGKPPKDKREANVRIFVVWEWEEWFMIWEIWKDWFLKKRKARELETNE